MEFCHAMRINDTTSICIQGSRHDIRASLVERLIAAGASIWTFMEAHTFSMIALHKSRVKSISRFPRGRGPLFEESVRGSARPGRRLSYTCHFASPVQTSADIAGDIKRLFALMNVVALGHGKIDLFRVMCLSNPPRHIIRSVATVLYVPHTVISQYIISQYIMRIINLGCPIMPYVIIIRREYISRDRVSLSLLFNPLRSVIQVTDRRFNASVSQA